MKMGRRTSFYENRSFPDLSRPLPINENILYPIAMREIGKAMLIIREHAVEWLEKRFALPLPEKSKFEEMLERGLI